MCKFRLTRFSAFFRDPFFRPRFGFLRFSRFSPRVSGFRTAFLFPPVTRLSALFRFSGFKMYESGLFRSCDPADYKTMGFDFKDGGAGASAARNKLAAYLRGHGVRVYGNPPQDEDFWAAIHEYAKRHAWANPRIVYRKRNDNTFLERLRDLF